MSDLVPSFKSFGLSSIRRDKTQRKLKIDELPPELLIKIFGFLSKHKQVLLVNKLFYGIGCKVADQHACLRIDYRIHNYSECFPSIKNSGRQISKVIYVTDDWEEMKLAALISIIKRFSTSIKHLNIQWFNGDVTTSQLLELLFLIPNVECLVFDNIRPAARTPLQPSKTEVSNIDVLKLRELKNLELCDVSDDFANVFNFLPAGVLKELRLHRINLNVLDVLFKRQTNITKLKLFPIETDATIPDDTFDNLNMESFELKHCSIANIRTLLSKQTQLKSLKMHFVIIDDDFGNFVASQLNELQSLSMHVADTPLAVTVEKIIKLKGIKDVSLRFGPNTMNQLESLSLIHCPQITGLHLGDPSLALEVNLIKDLAKSLPNLKVLTINKFCKHCEFEAVISQFNFVEILEIHYNDRFILSIPSGSLNPNLRELSIDFWDFLELPDTSCLEKLIQIYPNLKKLTVSGITITSSLFRQIIDELTKLETLMISLQDVENELTVDDIKYAKNVKVFFKLDVFNFTNETRKQILGILGEKFCKLKFSLVGRTEEYLEIWCHSIYET